VESREGAKKRMRRSKWLTDLQTPDTESERENLKKKREREERVYNKRKENIKILKTSS